VQSERNQLLARLIEKLTPGDMEKLLKESVAYRAGQIRHTDFYEDLRDLTERHGVPLAHYKALDSYIQYVLLADSIDAEKLFEETRDLEDRAIALLAKTPEEKALMAEGRYLNLVGKLLDFALTKDEWNEYKNLLPLPQGGRGQGEGQELATIQAPHPALSPLRGARVPFGSAGEGRKAYSTVTDFARLRGWSTSVPLCTAT
jgi:hypothetical protein